MNIRKTLEELGVTPRKSRGQNFLVSQGQARKIVSAVTVKAQSVVEIGPGLGALTSELDRVFTDISVIEVEEAFADRLKNILPGVKVFRADALTFNWKEKFTYLPGPRVIFGNLPYNLSAPLIEKLFQNAGLFDEALFCLQKEFAERFISPGGRTMGPLSVLGHRFCKRREKLFNISPGAFVPKPKVTSTVIRLLLRKNVKWTELDRVIPQKLFVHRRKKLSSVIPEDILPRKWKDMRIDQLMIDDVSLLADRLMKHGTY